jgi:hypothetical protein
MMSNIFCALATCMFVWQSHGAVFRQVAHGHSFEFEATNISHAAPVERNFGQLSNVESVTFGSVTAKGGKDPLSRGSHTVPALHYFSSCHRKYSSFIQNAFCAAANAILGSQVSQLLFCDDLVNNYCMVANAILASKQFHDYIGAPLIQLDAAEVDGIRADFQVILCPTSSECQLFDSESNKNTSIPTLAIQAVAESNLPNPWVLNRTNIIGYFNKMHYKNYVAADDGSFNLGYELREINWLHPQDPVPLSLPDVMAYVYDHVDSADHHHIFLVNESDKDENGVDLRSKIKYMPFPTTWGSRKLFVFNLLRAQGAIDPKKPFARRSFDVFFRCSLYEYHPPNELTPKSKAWSQSSISNHRRKALSQLQAMKQKFESDPIRFPYTVHLPEESLSQWAYLKAMCNAKIVISPFGFGEYSFTDEQAAWCHTIVVKPGAKWFDTGPFPLYNQSSDIDVKLDFSNLEDVVLGLLQNPDDLQRRSTELGRVMDPYIGAENLLRRPDVLEEFASVLRPLLKSHSFVGEFDTRHE